MYRNALQIHVPRTGTDVDVILAAVEEYLMMLAKERIRIAFDHAQKDVGDLRQRTKEGIETARLNGKIIDHPKGQHSVSEREVRAKRQMMKRVRSVGDDLNASDCMKIIGISRKIYYKYKKRCYNNKIKMWICNINVFSVYLHTPLLSCDNQYNHMMVGGIRMNEQERLEILEKSKVFFREKIVVSHIKNTTKLESVKEFNINPFMHKYLVQFAFGNSDPESLAKVLIYPRVLETSMTINKDDVATIVGHFQAAIRLSRTNNLHISSDNCVVGVFYGEPKDLSANYRKTDKDFPVYIGRDFWHRLTGDEDFYDILTQNNPIGNLIMR